MRYAVWVGVTGLYFLLHFLTRRSAIAYCKGSDASFGIR
jgi:hypothetical protein